MSGTRLLGGGLLVLAAGLAINAVPGPLWLNVIDRTPAGATAAGRG